MQFKYLVRTVFNLRLMYLISIRWDTTPYGIVILSNNNHHIMFANRTFRKRMGMSLRKLRRHPIIDFLHKDDIEKTICTLARMQTGSSVSGFKNRCVDVNGKSISMKWDIDRNREVYWGRCYF